MDFLAGLNPRQREAVEHAEGPLLVLTLSQGAAKTRVITHRIAHLMSAHQVPGWAILAVTFTNKAAGEMRERVQSLVAGSESLPTVATFHSFCVRLLRRDGAPLAQIRPGFTTQFTIYDDDDQISLLKGVYKALGLDDKFMAYRAALSRISVAITLKQTPERSGVGKQPTPSRSGSRWSMSGIRRSCGNRTLSISMICCWKRFGCSNTISRRARSSIGATNS